MKLFKSLSFLAIIAVTVAIATYLTLPHIYPKARMAFFFLGAKQFNYDNQFSHMPPPDHNSRRVVRPSPDLAYSICAFNLKDNPQELIMHIPAARLDGVNYWSASAFAANTDNFWVMNDLDTDQNPVRVLVLSEAQGQMKQYMHSDNYADYIKVVAPTEKVALLLRHLILEESDIAQVDLSRADNICRPLGS